MGEFKGQFSFDAMPFQEAVAYFMAQGIVTRAEFDKMSAAMKVKAFTVAHSLAEGDEVEFEVEQGAKGAQAVNVVKL